MTKQCVQENKTRFCGFTERLNAYGRRLIRQRLFLTCQMVSNKCNVFINLYVWRFFRSPFRPKTQKTARIAGVNIFLLHPMIKGFYIQR